MPMDTINIDTNRANDELYTDVTMKIINSSSSLLICTTASGQRDGEVLNLPSWVPDWARKRTAAPFEYVDSKNPYFFADKGRQPFYMLSNHLIIL
jgi:hypothetical protein